MAKDLLMTIQPMFVPTNPESLDVEAELEEDNSAFLWNSTIFGYNFDVHLNTVKTLAYFIPTFMYDGLLLYCILYLE